MQPPSNNVENHPQFELPQFREGLEKQTERSREKRPDKESDAGKSQPGKADATQPVIPDLSAIQAPTAVLPADDQTTSHASGVSPAADTDRIEKEWVSRAKLIVAQTRDDPHEQKKEISKVKAEYIQKRFGKAVPTDDAVTA